MRLGPLHPDDPALQVYRSLPPRPPAYLGWLVRLFGHKVIHWNRSVEVTYYIWLGREYLDKVEYVGDRWGINRLLKERDTDGG